MTCVCVPLVTFERLRHVVSSSQRISEPLRYTLLLLLAHKKRQRIIVTLSLFESYQPLSLYFVQFSSQYIENRRLSVHVQSLCAYVELVAEKGQEIKEMRREQRDSRLTPYIQMLDHSIGNLTHAVGERRVLQCLLRRVYIYREKMRLYNNCFPRSIACITCSVRLSSAVARDARSD